LHTISKPKSRLTFSGNVTAEEVEAEEVPLEDHHPQTDNLKEMLLSSSQEIEKEAKLSCWPSKSIKE